MHGLRAIVACSMVLGSSLAALGTEFATMDFGLVVRWEGKPRLTYKYNDVPCKPYLVELFTPQGVTPLMDSPADHPHHHGLMFAVTVDGVNFWEERDAPGVEKHKSFAEFTHRGFGDFAADIVPETLRWLGPDGTPLLEESRTLILYQGERIDRTLLTWTTTLTPVAERVTLTGAHYQGLGVRFHDSMVFEGMFLNGADAEGEVVRGRETLTRAAWCAYQGRAEGAPVTWAMFDHPGNARHPATWFGMNQPFASMSATLNLHREPLVIAKESPLTLTYGIALWDGHVDKETIEAAYQQWLALSKSP